MTPGDHQSTKAPGAEFYTPPGRPHLTVCAVRVVCEEQHFCREECMNESDTDIQMFAQWIAHAAGFAASLAESQEHAHHPEAWRSELDGLIVLGRMVMLDSPMSAVEPAVRLALQEALVDGEAQLHYLTFSYLPARNHHADADSSPEVM